MSDHIVRFHMIAPYSSIDLTMERYVDIGDLAAREVVEIASNKS